MGHTFVRQSARKSVLQEFQLFTTISTNSFALSMVVVVLWTTPDISKGLALLQIQDIDFTYKFRIFILVQSISGILDLETSSVFNFGLFIK